MEMITGAILILSGVMTYVGQCALRAGIMAERPTQDPVLKKSGPSIGGLVLIVFGVLFVLWGVMSQFP